MPDVFVSKKPKKSGDDDTIPTEGVPKNLEHIEGHTDNPLTSYCYYPHHVDFVGTDSEEQIVLILRKHPLTNVSWIVMGIILFSVPLLLTLFGLLNFMPAKFQIVAIMFWYLISIAFVFEQFLSWFFNVYIITDERVFDVDFINLTYREITDAEIEDIQDVTVKVGSVIRTIFDFGDIQIQTAAEIPEIEFIAVPHPDKVAQVLRELRVQEDQEKIEGRVR